MLNLWNQQLSSRWTCAVAAVVCATCVGCGDSGGNGAQNSAPLARAARADGSTPAVVGETLQLDASGSSDPDGDALTYKWEIDKAPSESSATLADANEAVARFTPDTTGDYAFRLTVDDGASSASATVEVQVSTAANSPPTADAGPDTMVPAGQVVHLSGLNSSDPDGDSLTYAWSFRSQPTGSSAELNDATVATPQFRAAQPGVYQLELVVSDASDSATDTVEVRANAAPVAEAGADLDGEVGKAAALDASASSDPDGDSLTYQWSVVSRPDQSTAEVVDAAKPIASVTPDVPGIYVLGVQVSDGHSDDDDRVTLRAAPPGGGPVSSTIYVAADGDDQNPGTQQEPLATLGKAVARASTDEKITRVRLAEGTYDQGSTSQDLSDDLTIVGPADGAPPTLVGSEDLIEVNNGAFVTLLRVELKGKKDGVQVKQSSTLSLVEVTCHSDTCVQFGGAGRIEVTRSTLSGTGGQTSGIVGLGADQITVVDTTIEEYPGFGINLLAAALDVRDSTIRNNDVGVRVLGNQVDQPTMIKSTQLDGNENGVKIQRAANVTLRDTTIAHSAERGLIANGGAVRLDTVTIKNSGQDGMILEGTGSQGAVVTARDSEIFSNLGDGIRLDGKGVSLDLGTASQMGGNTVKLNKGIHLHDARPDDATGYVTMSDTKLGPQKPLANTYTGPNYGMWGMQIDNNNSITVY